MTKANRAPQLHEVAFVDALAGADVEDELPGVDGDDRGVHGARSRRGCALCRRGRGQRDEERRDAGSREETVVGEQIVSSFSG